LTRACDPVVVKLGGSVITRKDEPLTVDERRLAAAAEALASFYRARGDAPPRLVVVHGGGSFGHYMVEKLRSEKGYLGPLETAEVQHAMLTLSTRLARVLLDLGVPASVHPAHSLCGPRGCDLRRIVEDVILGMVPVTYGDAIPGEAGARIVSGDTLAVQAAALLGAKCLVFVTDSGGVYGADGRILRVYTGSEALANVDQRAPDVTGGMRAKLAEALEYARDHPEATVLIVGVEDLRAALEGGEAGTLVKPMG